MLKEFKEFAFKGNMLDLAVGVIIGAAFGNVVKSLVEDIIMPPIGFLTGNVDFSNIYVLLKEGPAIKAPYNTLADALKAGAVVVKVGAFFNIVISFFIISFCVFMLVRQIHHFRKKDEEAKAAIPTPEVALLTDIRDLLKK